MHYTHSGAVTISGKLLESQIIIKLFHVKTYFLIKRVFMYFRSNNQFRIYIQALHVQYMSNKMLCVEEKMEFCNI